MNDSETVQMSVTRAQEIALALMKYMATRKEFTLNPQERKPDSGLEFAAKIGVPVLELRAFTFMVTAPAALAADAGNDVEIVFKGDKPTDQRIREIALAMIKERSLCWSPNDFLDRLRSAQKSTGIPEAEIRIFYALYLQPYIMSVVGRFRYLKVTASHKTTGDDTN